MYCSPPGSSVHGVSKARNLKWVPISFFKQSSPDPRDQAHVSWLAGSFSDSLVLSQRRSLYIYIYAIFVQYTIFYMKVKSLSRVRLFVILWTVAYQASQSMGFSRQEYWRGLPFPSPGDLLNPGIEPRSPTL